MEEDINILEKMIEEVKQEAISYNKYCYEIEVEQVKAIENLLKRYKELEEENKRLIIAKAETLQEMRKYKGKYENLKIRHNGTKEALRVAEDLEKQYSQEASNLEAELDNCIPISVIQNKIDELKGNIPYLSSFKDWKEKDYTNEDIINNCIEVLQELLEERNK